MRWEGHVARMGDKRRAYEVLVRKGDTEGKRTLARYRRRWEDDNDNGYSRGGRGKHELV